MAEPGFFVPVFRAAFYTAGKCGAKKGGVNELGKLRSRAIAERSNFDLLTLRVKPVPPQAVLSWAGCRGFCAPLGVDGFTIGD